VNGFVWVGMGGDIVEDAVGGGKVVLGGVGLVEGNLADGSKDRKVQSSCIEEQGCNHLWDSSLFCERDWGRASGWRWVEVQDGKRCRWVRKVECRQRVMRPTHTPKDRDETAWRGCSLTWRGACSHAG
jgi:hypothetical protein